MECAMLRASAFALIALATGPALAQTPASVPQGANPRAIELFQRDWLLMDWALRRFDADRDVQLSASEAQPAAAAFKDIADGDRDGRVTPYEFERAKDFILARY